MSAFRLGLDIGIDFMHGVEKREGYRREFETPGVGARRILMPHRVCA